MGLKKKRAQMIGVVSTLAVASLVSVGFAGWTISTSQTKDGQTTISADCTVTDESIGTLQEADGTETVIKFGGPANASTGWLTHSGDITEDLTAKFIWTFVVGSSHSGDPSIPASGKTGAMDWKAETKTAWNSSVSAGLVAALPSFEKKVNGPSEEDLAAKTYAYYYFTAPTGQSATWTLTVDIKLNWGSAFEDQNPFDYYNKISKPSSTDISAAKTNITALSALNGTLTFSFTVS